MTMKQRTTDQVMQSRRPAWFQDVINRKPRVREGDTRTLSEQCFDSGVFAAAEFIRRLTGDEALAPEIPEVCS